VITATLHVSFPVDLEEAALVGKGDSLVDVGARAEMSAERVMRRTEAGRCVDGGDPCAGRVAHPPHTLH